MTSYPSMWELQYFPHFYLSTNVKYIVIGAILLSYIMAILLMLRKKWKLSYVLLSGALFTIVATIGIQNGLFVQKEMSLKINEMGIWNRSSNYFFHWYKIAEIQLSQPSISEERIQCYVFLLDEYVAQYHLITHPIPLDIDEDDVFEIYDILDEMHGLKSMRTMDEIIQSVPASKHIHILEVPRPDSNS